MNNKNLNEITNCHSGHPTHVILNLIQDLIRDAECPQHDNRMCEGGRSMVEMLGVLAVIGVLTIIGIAGFKMAMNKHYANQTVERLMRRAAVVAGQANFGQNPSLHEFDENDGEYPISRTLKSTSESFTMRVDNVPQAVCQQIIGMDWKLAKIIPEDCSDETMEFMFLNDLTDCTECQPETFPCEDYGTECGKCSPVKGFFANEGNACTDPDKQYCVMGRCEVCPAGQIDNNGCMPCSNITREPLANPEDCNKCVNEQGQPTHFRDDSGYCSSCTGELRYTFSWTSTLDECNRCSNRCLRKDNSTCIIPGVKGSAYNNNDFTSFIMDPNGSGYCVCAEGYHMDANNKCVTD